MATLDNRLEKSLRRIVLGRLDRRQDGASLAQVDDTRVALAEDVLQDSKSSRSAVHVPIQLSVEERDTREWGIKLEAKGVPSLEHFCELLGLDLAVVVASRFGIVAHLGEQCDDSVSNPELHYLASDHV